MEKFSFLVFPALIALIISSCCTDNGQIGEVDLEKYSSLHDTSFLGERLKIYSKIGLRNFMNLSSDSAYIRIRLASKYNDSTEYFDFSGKENIEFAVQTFVDKVDLGKRNESIEYINDNIAQLYLRNFSFDEFMTLFLNEYKFLQKDLTPGGIEYQIEFFKDSKYLRLIFTSYLYHISGIERIIYNLLTVSNLQSKILSINNPQVIPIIEADKHAFE